MLDAIYRRGILVAVATLIICLLGLVAAIRVPVQMIPDLDVRVVSVQTLWPGGTPQDVEKEILIEQETVLRSLPSLQRMKSTAITGEAIIELEFPFGVDMTEALIRVNNALSQVSDYPENVDDPRLFTDSFSSNAFMYYAVQPLPDNPADLDIDMVRDFIEDFVRPRLERVPGVSQLRFVAALSARFRSCSTPPHWPRAGWASPRFAMRSANATGTSRRAILTPASAVICCVRRDATAT